MTIEEKVLNYIKQVKSISETGLVYTDDDYDKDRYNTLLEASLKLLSDYSGESLAQLKGFYKEITDYPTPNVDVRALILNPQSEILMVQEKVDGKWSIPGGWADIGLSPKESIEKEVEEETGLKVRVNRLLSIWDKKMHNHPPRPHYVYKMCFLCSVVSGELRQAFDTLAVRYFPIDHLPSLSEDRIIESQIIRLYNLSKGNDKVEFD